MGLTISLVVPAGTGGVRDYADILAKKFNDAGHNARVVSWHESDASAIDRHFESSDCVYLQYSGYGYAKRGAPLWMLRHLQTRRTKIKRFGVFFHELFAFGPPWSSAFWLSPVQRQVAAGLARLADFWVTNREGSSEWLMRHASAVPHATLPVFSNVGESPTYNPDRDPIAVVFGSGALRHMAWEAAGSAIFDWADRNGLSLHDVGPPLADARLMLSLQNRGVISHGKLSADAVSRLMIRAQYGVVAYPIEYVAKSGVFAAYCAHGMAPLIIAKNHISIDGLSKFKHYFPAERPEYTTAIANLNIGMLAHEWYQPHSIRGHLETTLNLA